MKKNYERFEMVVVFIILFLISLLIFSGYLMRASYQIYTTSSAIVTTDHTLQVVVDCDQLAVLAKNKTIYLEGKKKKIRLIKIWRNILKRHKTVYHQVLLEVELDRKYRELEVVTLSIYKQQRKLITIFSSCWKGG